MQVKPVKHYSDPSFPTRSILDERPELLRLVPKRWQRNPAVLTALAGLCALALGTRAIADDAKKEPINKIAPLFVHGEGSGAFGCIAVNPPVFLSEEEAKKVIEEEAKRLGVEFQRIRNTVHNISLPVVNSNGLFDEPSPYRTTEKRPWLTSSLSFDGFEPTKKICYEYVSIEDYNTLEWKGERSSTVWGMDIKETVELIKSSLSTIERQETTVFFYDPCSGPRDVEKLTGVKTNKAQIEQWKMPKTATAEERWKNTQAVKAEYEDMQAKARDISREELRKQVKDFIKWLKAEGVI